MVQGDQGGELAVATVKAVVRSTLHVLIVDDDAGRGMHGRGVVDCSKVDVQKVEVGVLRGEALGEVRLGTVRDGNVVVAVGDASASYTVVKGGVSVTVAVEADWR